MFQWPVRLHSPDYCCKLSPVVIHERGDFCIYGVTGSVRYSYGYCLVVDHCIGKQLYVVCIVQNVFLAHTLLCSRLLTGRIHLTGNGRYGERYVKTLSSGGSCTVGVASMELSMALSAAVENSRSSCRGLRTEMSS